MILIVINVPRLSIIIFIKDVLSVRSLLNSNGINKTYALKSAARAGPEENVPPFFKRLRESEECLCRMWSKWQIIIAQDL